MMDKSRRKFLGRSSASLLGVVMATKLFPTKVAFASSEVTLCEAAINEFAYVYRSWLKTEVGSPSLYIAQSGLSSDSSLKQIQALSSTQFRRAETHQLDGLVLSKIEVALMADVGRLYC